MQRLPEDAVTPVVGGVAAQDVLEVIGVCDQVRPEGAQVHPDDVATGLPADLEDGTNRITKDRGEDLPEGKSSRMSDRVRVNIDRHSGLLPPDDHAVREVSHDPLRLINIAVE
ncbi:hypothetical protein Msi02_51800 [Microbispora siamensis]|uniref:Uncharacterized protein n=1 Tax=Microbispora siamensis TaxID=564413 RepID=A0ABQ4GSE9_9ACTN|nr:hypothetical protein Msi02_51800 [Microbispora siamensis]